MVKNDEIVKLQKRFLLFLVGCIGIRVLMVYISKYGSYNVNMFLAVIALLIGIGFFRIYFGGLRKVGLETQGAPIWWNHLRPLHGLLYLLFSIMVFANIYYNYAWVILAIDVMIGLFAFLHFHYVEGNIQKLFTFIQKHVT
jgi:hypothetical protein